MATAIASDFAIVPLDALKAHEEVVSESQVAALAARIEKDGFMQQPIVADRATLVILDGHHRWAALKGLGAVRAPVNLVDYGDDRIRVESWRAGVAPPSKDDVISRALAGKPFPPKTTKHESLYGLPPHVVPLADLRAKVR